MPAFFCLSQALALPPSAVGSMSEGGVLSSPRLSCKWRKNARVLSLRRSTSVHVSSAGQKGTDRVSQHVAVGGEDVLGSDERQEGRQDLFQLLHVQVPLLHAALVDAVGCAAQQVGL